MNLQNVITGSIFLILVVTVIATIANVSQKRIEFIKRCDAQLTKRIGDPISYQGQDALVVGVVRNKFRCGYRVQLRGFQDSMFVRVVL